MRGGDSFYFHIKRCDCHIEAARDRRFAGLSARVDALQLAAPSQTWQVPVFDRVPLKLPKVIKY